VNKPMQITLRPKASQSGFFIKFWNILVSPAGFVLLSSLWSLDLAIGSIIAYKRDPKFWTKMDSMPFDVWLERFAPMELPHSLWVYLLVGLTWLVMISLVLCTIGWFLSRRARHRGMAEVLVHLGFMLVFIGFIIGNGWGERVQNVSARQGEVLDIDSLGVRLKLDGVDIKRDEAGNALDTISRVSLFNSHDDLLVEGEARLNHPLIYGATVVYPAGGGERVTGATLLIGGMGSVSVDSSLVTALLDGRELRVKGALDKDQRYSRWVGPGVFITLSQKGGPEMAGVFVGELPTFEKGRLGNLDVTYVKSIKSIEANFNVHRDPGVWFVILGALILGLGTIWALGGYLRRT
jgi:hypothetical protein